LDIQLKTAEHWFSLQLDIQLIRKLNNWSTIQLDIRLIREMSNQLIIQTDTHLKRWIWHSYNCNIGPRRIGPSVKQMNNGSNNQVEYFINYVDEKSISRKHGYSFHKNDEQWVKEELDIQLNTESNT
jgi:hypothetical protein